MTGQIEYSLEAQLLREIGYWRCKRSDVARTYRLALHSKEPADWDKVHQAIIERWSYFAVEWIRREAKRDTAA